jgi:mannose-6-phosphate isomerase-like protein (cupin superfamily)
MQRFKARWAPKLVHIVTAGRVHLENDVKIRELKMGQYIQVGESHNTPSGAQWRGGGVAEVDSGRGQYIHVGESHNMPSGAQWRGGGWAEVNSGQGQYIQVGASHNVPSGAQWRGGGWAEVN